VNVHRQVTRRRCQPRIVPGVTSMPSRRTGGSRNASAEPGSRRPSTHPSGPTAPAHRPGDARSGTPAASPSTDHPSPTGPAKPQLNAHAPNFRHPQDDLNREIRGRVVRPCVRRSVEPVSGIVTRSVQLNLADLEDVDLHRAVQSRQQYGRGLDGLGALAARRTSSCGTAPSSRSTTSRSTVAR